MFGFESLSIEFLTNTPFWVALGLVVLLALSFLMYRRTNPPLPRYLLIILGTLRLVAVVALCLALFEPVLSYTRDFVRQKRVAVLVDHSGSMEREEDGKTRQARVDSLLSTDTFDRLRTNTDVTFYYFGGDMATDATEIADDKTALGDALFELEKVNLTNPFDHVLLLSDGNSNSGRDPRSAAQQVTRPISAIGVATTGRQFDIALGDIDYNPVAFVGRPSPITVQFSWRQGEDKAIEVQLRDDVRIVGSRGYRIDQADGFGDITIDYTPEQPGEKLLTVRIPALEGEQTAANNERTIAIKVLKSRMNVLIVTDQPDYEVGFLSRFLRQSEKYAVELLSLGRQSGNLTGSFPNSQAELNQYDLVVLHDLPPGKLAPHAAKVKSYLEDRGGAVWYLMAHHTAAAAPPDWLAELLPFYHTSPSRVIEGSFHGEPSEDNLFHPAVRLADDRSAIRSLWSQLPPFHSVVPCDTVQSAAEVLVNVSGRLRGEQLPALGYMRHGPGKLLAIAALPVWPWGFVTLGYGENHGAYARFVDGAVSWLTLRDDFDPIRILPEKQVFSRGEPVLFEGFAFDPGFRPLPDVSGSVQLEAVDGDTDYDIDFIAVADGKYRAEFKNVRPGAYTWTGRLMQDDRLLKEATGEIMVETFSLEEFDQSGDPTTLAAIARLTGGNYYSVDKFSQAVAGIDMSPVTGSLTGELSLWGRWWLLLIFIAALSIEWLVRKANQLL